MNLKSLYQLSNSYQKAQVSEKQEQQMEQGRSITSTMKDIFAQKTLGVSESQEEIENQTSVKQEINYYQLAKTIQDVKADNKDVQRQLIEIYRDIKKVVDESYENPTLIKLLKTVPTHYLCHFAVEQFIGSMTQPKNEKVMELLLEHANLNAKTEYEKMEVEYYKIYLNKLAAVQGGQKDKFEESNDQLVELSQRQFPIAMHIVAKELYKVALNANSGKFKKQKKQMIQQAAQMFQEAAAGGANCAFFYLGDMAQTGDLPGGIDLQYAFECFLISASFDYPQAFFKLAQFYKEGLIDKKDSNLEFYYTKKAAELGVVEAQHNLGCMYLEKRITNYNSVKALAWFTQASASNFAHSMYNVAKLFMEGSEDQKIRVNYKAALIYFEKLEKLGTINVDKQVDECLKQLQMKETQDQKQKQTV